MGGKTPEDFKSEKEWQEHLDKSFKERGHMGQTAPWMMGAPGNPWMNSWMGQSNPWMYGNAGPAPEEFKSQKEYEEWLDKTYLERRRKFEGSTLNREYWRELSPTRWQKPWMGPESSWYHSRVHNDESKKESEANGENALEVIHSHMPTGKISDENKTNLFDQMRATLKDFKILEEKRINLSLRFDFCLTEMFQQIDTGKTGYITLNDLDRWIRASGISMNREDWALIIDRFDRDGDQYLSMSEFSEIFTPYTVVYRKGMVDRCPKDIANFSDYTIQTKKYVKDLLYSVVTALENFECNKFKITGGLVHVSNEVFDFLDRNKDGYITYNEFSATLKENGVKCPNPDCKILFDTFDKKKNGKISFGEFHTPTKGY